MRRSNAKKTENPRIAAVCIPGADQNIMLNAKRVTTNTKGEPIMQTIADMFRTTRGGKLYTGRCEACDEVLGVDEVTICQDCEFNNLLEEERDN